MNKAEVIEKLTQLLQREYLQRDIYETYSYYLFGVASPAIQEHLKGHLAEEQLHIETLQRYLMGFGARPVTQRMKVPVIDPLKLENILEINFELENEAVEKYSETIEALEGHVEYVSLRVDLEDILKQEQEHSHDLIRWCERFSSERSSS
tara:strand:- start:53 stop:502 length:450 start_codon:yes stop_codon:yes gene_type:complete